MEKNSRRTLVMGLGLGSLVLLVVMLLLLAGGAPAFYLGLVAGALVGLMFIAGYVISRSRR